MGAEAVALIAPVPGGNGFFLLHILYKGADEFDLKMDDFRIRKEILFFKGCRGIDPAGHPACDQPYNEFELILFRKAAECMEALHHNWIHPRLPEGGIRKSLFSHAVFTGGLAALKMEGKGLEIAPQWEDSQYSCLMGGKPLEIFFHPVGIPVAPHEGPGMGCPVVAACKKGAFPGKKRRRISTGIRFFLHEIFAPL